MIARNPSRNFFDRPRRIKGFTLVELMVAMLLGLVVIGGALGVILSNRQSYRTNEGLSQIQESARTAFELLARDVRQAGVTGCNNDGRVANVVRSTGGTPWWQDWFGIRGFDGATEDGAVAFGTNAATFSNRVAGTDSIHLQGIEGTGLTVEDHNPTSANIKLNVATTIIAPNDILMICDFDHAAIVKVSQYNSANVTVVHNTQQNESPYNCSNGLGYPTLCGNPGNGYRYGPNSQIAKLSAVDWYIGDNGRAAEGGRSLYRRRLGSAEVEEIVAGVTDMQITYRESGRSDFRDATNVGVWDNVNAVMISLTMESADRRVTTDPTVNSGRLQRQFSHIVTLRNRVP